jgi:hypothetical protein
LLTQGPAASVAGFLFNDELEKLLYWQNKKSIKKFYNPYSL